MAVAGQYIHITLLTYSLTVVVLSTSSSARVLHSEIVVQALDSVEQLQLTVCCFRYPIRQTLIATGTAGCHAAFGTCTSTNLSPDGTCKMSKSVVPVVAANDLSIGEGTSRYKCKGSGYGDCCSSSGYCGSTTSHCTAGCQTGFGTCTVSDISSDGTCGA
jgi:hypothetical protein